MSARDVIARALCDAGLDNVRDDDAPFIIQALHVAGYRLLAPGQIDDWTRQRDEAHLREVASAMWERCEQRRSIAENEVTPGEKDDATTAWCFERAADSLRSLGGRE